MWFKDWIVSLKEDTGHSNLQHLNVTVFGSSLYRGTQAYMKPLGWVFIQYMTGVPVRRRDFSQKGVQMTNRPWQNVHHY